MDQAPEIVLTTATTDSALDHTLGLIYKVMVIIALPALVFSLLRTYETGWQWSFYLHIGAFLLLLSLLLWRHSLPLPSQAAVLLGLLFLTGATGLAVYGIAGAGLLVLTSFCITTAVLLGKRAGLIALGTSLTAIILIGTAITSGWLPQQFNPEVYLKAATSWLMIGSTFVLFVLPPVIGLAGLQRQQKGAMESQKAILATLPDQLFELDGEGRFLDIWAQNPDELVASEDQLLGRTVSEMLPADAARQVMEALREADEKGQSHGQQIQLVTPVGELWFELATSLKDRDSSPHRFMMLSRNISQRKEDAIHLEYLATHDPLTGLYNRMVLEQRLTDDVHRADRYNHNLSLLILDIDHFKTINDTYGHQVGDAVLRSFAQVLKQSIRHTDYAARYGGEEFVAILPETSLDKARELTERMLNNIAEHSILIEDGTEFSITVSIGVATLPDHAKSWEELVKAADQAMYVAKKSGRNQVKTA